MSIPINNHTRRVRRALGERRMSVVRLAKLTGYNRSHVNGWLHLPMSAELAAELIKAIESVDSMAA